MTLISKRQRIMLVLVFAASFSQAFLIAPISQVSRLKIQEQVGNASKPLRSHQIPHTRLWLSKDKETTVDKTAVDKGFLWAMPGEESSPSSPADLSGGRFSMIMAQAQDVLTPATQFIDDATDGWALSYADLSPETEGTPVGQAFLATNIAYALVGLSLSFQGDTFLGLLTEICSVASFIYHYTQLRASSNSDEDGNVRLALLVDYVFAFTSIFVGLGYIVMDQRLPPMEGLVSGGVAIACLLACWVWEQGLPYIVLHSLWHLFSAYCGYVIGNSHLLS